MSTRTLERETPRRQAESRGRILLVDDDRIILDSLSEFLGLAGFDATLAPSLQEAVDAMNRDPVDVVLSDVNMPGGNGFELLHTIRKRWPETSVIMMTGYGTIESAVEAMRMGAFDYLTKPILDDELGICIDRAMSQQALVRENRCLRERLEHRYGLDGVIGRDYRMGKIFELVESVAASKVTVLIQGASGTGKSLMANVIHQQSDRREEPFVEVACGAIPESLLESELFGHVRGSFTGATANKAGKFKAAHKGTIFLDEIATASPALQIKLLRVLQSRQFEPIGSNRTETVDVRVILATNVDLEAEVRAGRFREDLYYRINVVNIHMPSLCERLGDIPLLADSFLQRFCGQMKRERSGFDDAARLALQRYRWPGNVRELENAIERAVVLSKGSLITAADLPERVTNSPIDSTSQASIDFVPTTLARALEEPERRIIEAALRVNHGNRQLTAAQLEINRTTLYKKMKKYGLDAASVM